MAAEGAKELIIVQGKNIQDDETFLTESKADVDGVSNQDVLVDAKGKIHGVKVGDKYYALGDVEANEDGELVAKDGDDTNALTLEDAWVEGAPAGIDVTSRQAANDA